MASAVVISGLYAAVLLVCCLPPWCSAVDYTVGDSSGWRSGYDYSAWTRGKTFSVGDTLKFNYARGAHNVANVSASDYSSCTAANPSPDSSGTTTISLTTAGTHFFICGVPGHCAGGMKLAVTVGRATPSAPSPPAPPSDVTPTTPVSDQPSSCGRLVPSASLVLVGIALLEYSLF
ncbi:hypothetical protein Taro_002837 [Colocasia esculenta]|uniref:Phytocyanin domain-containing protein n=1 Tax=Colocasia esculenta TaxID=4460 RepID=A0A843TQ11_COLES|nr:hypothetical protein [Colocasia esculenta]